MMQENKRRKISIKDIVYISTTVLLVGGLITTSILLNVKKNNEVSQDYYDKKVAQFTMENGNFSKGQIVFIGDSITDLYHLDDYYQDLSLRTYNRGIGGDVTGMLLKRIQVSLYDLEPTKVVLMIGINDINGGVSTNTILENYDNILKGIKTKLPETKVYTMSILPINNDLPAYIDVDKSTERIVSINEEIKTMSSNYSYQYMDLFSLVNDDKNHLKKEYSLDGIHLSEQGFVTWTNLIKPELK